MSGLIVLAYSTCMLAECQNNSTTQNISPYKSNNCFQGKLSETWTDVTKAAIGEAILAVTKMEESLRQNQAFMKTPTVGFIFIETFIHV